MHGIQVKKNLISSLIVMQRFVHYQDCNVKSGITSFLITFGVKGFGTVLMRCSVILFSCKDSYISWILAQRGNVKAVLCLFECEIALKIYILSLKSMNSRDK